MQADTTSDLSCFSTKQRVFVPVASQFKATDNHFKILVSYSLAIMPRIGAISPAIIREVPAHVRWSCCAMKACIESPPAFPFFFSEPLCEILSRRIAKRVTLLQRCENIRSSDKHRCNAQSV